MTKTENKQSHSKEGSVDSLYEESNKTDEEDAENEQLITKTSQDDDDDEWRDDYSPAKTFSHNNVYIPIDKHEETLLREDENDEQDLDIEKEFENYLNDENNDDNNDAFYINNYVPSSSGPGGASGNLFESENHKLKYIKLKKLENLEYTLENYELFRQMGVEKYGFINKKYRRKVWPLLILYKNNSKENLNLTPSGRIQSNTSKVICKHYMLSVFNRLVRGKK